MPVDGADPLKHLNAVQPRHEQVENDDVRVKSLIQLPGLRAVARLSDHGDV